MVTSTGATRQVQELPGSLRSAAHLHRVAAPLVPGKVESIHYFKSIPAGAEKSSMEKYVLKFLKIFSNRKYTAA